MRLILLQDIEKVGKKYEIKEVSDGYARNFLIPRGLAKQATKQAIKWTEVQKDILAKKAEESLQHTQSIASPLDGLELTIPMKIGEEGQLYESVGQQKILEGLQKTGFNIKKSQVVLEEPIKELGEFPVKIKFDHNLEAEIKVIVTEEK